MPVMPAMTPLAESLHFSITFVVFSHRVNAMPIQKWEEFISGSDLTNRQNIILLNQIYLALYTIDGIH